MKNIAFSFFLSRLSSLLLGACLMGCAALHHIQIGEVENRSQFSYEPIEVKVSEMGIDLQDINTLNRTLLDQKSAKQGNDALAFLSYFQMGPHTGAGVYDLTHMYKLEKVLYSQCSNGFLTGLTQIRETRKYPVISGEIIKIKGYCARLKGS